MRLTLAYALLALLIPALVALFYWQLRDSHRAAYRRRMRREQKIDDDDAAARSSAAQATPANEVNDGRNSGNPE